MIEWYSYYPATMGSIHFAELELGFLSAQDSVGRCQDQTWEFYSNTKNSDRNLVPIISYHIPIYSNIFQCKNNKDSNIFQPTEVRYVVRLGALRAVPRTVDHTLYKVRPPRFLGFIAALFMALWLIVQLMAL